MLINLTIPVLRTTMLDVIKRRILPTRNWYRFPTWSSIEISARQMWRSKITRLKNVQPLNWILLELRIFQIYQLTEKIKRLSLLSIMYQLHFLFQSNERIIKNRNGNSKWQLEEEFREILNETLVSHRQHLIERTRLFYKFLFVLRILVFNESTCRG